MHDLIPILINSRFLLGFGAGVATMWLGIALGVVAMLGYVYWRDDIA